MPPTPALSTAATAAVFPRRAVGAPPHVLGVLPGEGIGPEVIHAALRVLTAVEPDLPLDLRLAASWSGGEGVTAEEEDFFAGIFAAGGTVLCGPRGGRFVYELRRRFDLFLKLSPLRVSPALAVLSRLKAAAVEGADVLVVRDNAGGVYQGEWGEERGADGERIATHAFSARESDVRRVMEAAAAVAGQRRGRLAVIGKEGGIPTVTRLWREVAAEVAGARGIAWELVNVDFAAYRLVQEPRWFDVVVAPNLEGDVLADVGAVLLGSRGLSFSGNFTPSGLGVYQTNHGAAADLAGRDVANPLGQIFSLAMLLRESLGRPAAAEAIETAVETVLARGIRTADLIGEGERGRIVGTREMTDLVIEALAAQAPPA
jgi:3-isopropylmalate dehydrogenase